MAISHVFSNQIADGTNTNIVRPSDWNSAHIQHYTLSGNTLGVSTVSGTNVIFEGAGNVSLSGTGRTIVVYATGGGGGVAVSAGTQSASTGTINFANSNGVTFGMDGSNQITASVAGGGGGGGAMYANLSGNTSGNTTASGSTLNFSGINLTLSGTNGSQIAISAPATSALTQGNNISISNTGVTIGISAQAVAAAAGSQTAVSGTVNFVNSNGVTFGMSGSNQITASVAGGGGAMYANLSGNTSGNTTASGSTLNFSGINLTLSGTNGSQIAISAPATSGITNGNNITITTSGSTIGISAQAVAAAAGSQTATSGTINFANSNGITFGMAGSNQITASHNGITTQTVQTQASGNIAGSGFSSTTTAGTAITAALGTNGLIMAIPAYLTAAGGGGGVAVGAGTQTATSGTVIFSNSNGITFGLDNGTLTASAAAAPTSYVSNVNGSSGAISLNVGSSLSSSTAGSSITFGLASNITTALQSANANYLTSQSNQAFSASGGSSTFQTLNFANSNGVTFSNSGGSIVASYTVPTSYVSDVNGSSGQISLNVGSSLSSSTAGSSITFGLASNITTALQSAGAYLTTAAQSSASNLSIAVAATNSTGGGTATLASSISFSNANGLTFYTSAGNAIVASYTVPTQSIQTQASGAIAGTGFTSATTAGSVITAALGTNGLNLGVPAYLTTQSIQTQASGAIAGTGFTTATTAGTVITGALGTDGLNLGIPAYLTAAGGVMYANLSGNTSGNTTASGSTLNFSGINLTLSGTNNSQIAISAPATSSLVAGANITISTAGSTISIIGGAGGGGGVALGASTQTATSGTVNFANSNGITFGMSGSSQITASHDGITTQTVQTQASGAIAGTGFTSTTTAGSVITGALGTNGLNLGVPAYLTTQSVQTQASGNIAGTGFTTATTAGTVITGALGTDGLNLGIPAYLTAAGGGGAINVSAGTTSNNLQTVVFSNSNGVSFGLNGSTITASVAPQLTLSGYNHYNDVVQSIGAVGQGSLIFDPVDLANAIQFDRFGLMMFNSNATNSSGSHTVSFWIGLYTKNVSTLSLLQSTSTTIGATHSGTAGSYSLYSAVRKLNIPFTTTLSEGAYFLGFVSRTTSGGANGTYNNLQQSNVNSDYRGLWGSAVNATNQVYQGAGYYSATTAGLPGSVAFSQINGTVGGAFRPPVIIFQSGNY